MDGEITKPEWFPKNKNYESFLFAALRAAKRAVREGKIPDEDKEKGDGT